MEEAKQAHDTHAGTAHQANHPEAHKQASKLPPFSAIPQLEEWLEEYLGHKAPQLPQHWRETIAKFAPWVTLVVFVLALPLIFGVFGLSFVLYSSAAVVGAVQYGAWGWTMVLIAAASLILELIALPGLFKRSKQGWVFIFYAALVGAAAHILSFNFGSLIGDILSLYVIFQIKNQYK